MSVKVKRLEWVDLSNPRTIRYQADTPLGFFDAYEEDAPMGGRYAWAIFSKSKQGGKPITHDNTQKIDTAKQRCQEYFERLVLECLEVDNDPE